MVSQSTINFATAAFWEVVVGFQYNHWKTTKYGEHKLCDEIIGILSKKSDIFTETCLGLGYEIEDIRFDEDSFKKLFYKKNIEELLTNSIKIFSEFSKIFKNQIVLKNIIDETLQKLVQYNYLFKLD